MGDWKIGDAVEVEWQGGWYRATVLAAGNDRLRVHYNGFDDSWEEDIAPSRVRPALPPPQALWRIGERVQVQWKGKMYPAAVIAEKDGRFLVTYEGFEKSWDEWATPDRIRI